MTRRAHPEDDLQVQVAHYLTVLEAQGHLIWFSVPNEGKRSWASISRMKKMGLRSGVPDICVVFPGGRVGFLELKSKSGRPTPTQKIWFDAFDRMGVQWAVCRDLDQVIGTLRAWLPMKRRAA